MSEIKLPKAASSIQKGVPLKKVLDRPAIEQLAINLSISYPSFRKKEFITEAMKGLQPLSLTERGKHISKVLHGFLPSNYEEAIQVILESLTPPLDQTEDNGLAPMFYMPHCNYIADYGTDPKYNDGKDPFDVSMAAQYEITQRFTCEFSIRPFITANQDRTLEVLLQWMKDDNPHVRRLCSEGTRPRLPWSSKIQSFVDDPGPVIPILEELKDDPVLYVRRSVANHVGDIAKDHPELAFDLCEKWLNGASKELKWVIRHAVRNPFKKGVQRAIDLRQAAK